ncbi:hypothetical protein BCR36DRAFT_465929 [Piromyces finnis]|uniref:RNI-like protein n=1 Tax=Piromyces finnis TaxID=1754191 RepID=A0A1Y1UVI7_9FUNG|nr:hypothetical protein BCR36DRAFT_465929 [Piromyces finnis]|eukprot:ORX42059.1 hypothetical protein BCR36DRAFT_465929 [Piromyces finnis]
MSSVVSEDYNSQYIKLCHKYDMDLLDMNLVLDQGNDNGFNTMDIKWILSSNSKKLSSQDKISNMKKKVKILSELIKGQENLDILSLTQCYFAFSSRGFSKISETLASNNTIKVLYLKNNHLKKENIDDIVELIVKNKTITCLNLEENLLGSEVENMKKIGEALTKNKTIEDIILNHNQITSEGAIEFIKCLKKNRKIKKIDMKYNKFGNSFARYIMKLLPHNSLTELDLFGNNIDSDLLKKIDKKLCKINESDNDDEDNDDENEKSSISNKEYLKHQKNKIKTDNKSSHKKPSSKTYSLYNNKSSDIPSSYNNSFDVDLNLDLSMDLDSNFEIKNYDKYLKSFDSESEDIIKYSRNVKIEPKELTNYKKKNTEKNYTETFKIDLDKTDSIDDFIKFLSSQENISIDDLLSFNMDYDNKVDFITNEKLNMKNDNKNILNNFDFNINDNYINSNILFNSNNQYSTRSNDCQCNNIQDKCLCNRVNSKKNMFLDNLKDININDFNSKANENLQNLEIIINNKINNKNENNDNDELYSESNIYNNSSNINNNNYNNSTNNINENNNTSDSNFINNSNITDPNYENDNINYANYTSNNNNYKINANIRNTINNNNNIKNTTNNNNNNINNNNNNNSNNNNNNNYANANDNIVNNNYNKNFNEKSIDSNEFNDIKSNSTSQSDIKLINDKIYIDSSFENRRGNDNDKEDELSEVSSINSENCIPNKILSPELISQITQIMKENEYLKSRIKFHEDNGYITPEDIILLNKEYENNKRIIDNLKHKLIITSKENDKMNEEIEDLKRKEDSLIKQFEDKLFNLDIQYAKKIEDNEYELTNKYSSEFEKYINKISELEKEKILLCKTLKIMENKINSFKVKSENEKACIKRQLKNDIENKIRIILMKVSEFQHQKGNFEKQLEVLRKQYSQEISQKENKIKEKEKINSKLEYELNNKKKKLDQLNEKIISLMSEINTYKGKFKNAEYDMKIEIEKIKDEFRAREVKYQNEISILNDNDDQNKEIINKLKSDIKKKDEYIKTLYEKEAIRMKSLETSIFNCIHENSKKIISSKNNNL